MCSRERPTPVRRPVAAFQASDAARASLSWATSSRSDTPLPSSLAAGLPEELPQVRHFHTPVPRMCASCARHEQGA